MSEHTTSTTANYTPMPRPRRPAVEYVSDWQFFPDNPDDQARFRSSADTTAMAGDSEAGEKPCRRKVYSASG